MRKLGVMLTVALLVSMGALTSSAVWEKQIMQKELDALRAHEPVVKFLRDKDGSILLNIDDKHFRVLPQVCGMRV